MADRSLRLLLSPFQSIFLSIKLFPPYYVPIYFHLLSSLSPSIYLSPSFPLITLSRSLSLSLYLFQPLYFTYCERELGVVRDGVPDHLVGDVYGAEEVAGRPPGGGVDPPQVRGCFAAGCWRCQQCLKV